MSADDNNLHPRDTFRGAMITDCVAAGIDLGLAKVGDTTDPAVVAGFMAMRLDRYVEMLEGLVNGEDLAKVQALVTTKYINRSTQK